MTEARPCRKESASAPGLPRHIGVILDGNRRWARNHRLPTSDIYRAGAAKVPQFLTWCERAGIPVVSLWALSDPSAVDHGGCGSSRVSKLGNCRV
ncbi:undecaprenyl diphosphate synthase family protein [Streptomyces sp. V4I8]|uniref:undecaprenyl diphosphate synthase family protein n=1 Tax=Streptomyces sp. V4I8 TaxID=3156469 RepID=UPI003511C563